jgi:hypothetical protein
LTSSESWKLDWSKRVFSKKEMEELTADKFFLKEEIKSFMLWRMSGGNVSKIIKNFKKAFMRNLKERYEIPKEITEENLNNFFKTNFSIYRKEIHNVFNSLSCQKKNQIKINDLKNIIEKIFNEKIKEDSAISENGEINAQLKAQPQLKGAGQAN